MVVVADDGWEQSVHRVMIASAFFPPPRSLESLSGHVTRLHWCGLSTAKLQRLIKGAYSLGRRMPLRKSCDASGTGSSECIANDGNADSMHAIDHEMEGSPLSSKSCPHQIAASCIIASEAMKVRSSPSLVEWVSLYPDCILRTALKDWPCHRAIMAARCEYFHIALMPRWNQVCWSCGGSLIYISPSG